MLKVLRKTTTLLLLKKKIILLTLLVYFNVKNIDLVRKNLFLV